LENICIIGFYFKFNRIVKNNIRIIVLSINILAYFPEGKPELITNYLKGERCEKLGFQ
jgi:hypothetical protein